MVPAESSLEPWPEWEPCPGGPGRAALSPAQAGTAGGLGPVRLEACVEKSCPTRGAGPGAGYRFLAGKEDRRVLGHWRWRWESLLPEEERQVPLPPETSSGPFPFLVSLHNDADCSTSVIITLCLKIQNKSQERNWCGSRRILLPRGPVGGGGAVKSPSQPGGTRLLIVHVLSLSPGPLPQATISASVVAGRFCPHPSLGKGSELIPCPLGSTEQWAGQQASWQQEQHHREEKLCLQKGAGGFVAMGVG